MDGIGRDENGNFFVYLNESKQLTPCCCPVCGGNGLVPNGFYLTVTGQITTSSCAPETCRSCSGRGYILA